jgi:RHS repeat-associated protein
VLVRENTWWGGSKVSFYAYGTSPTTYFVHQTPLGTVRGLTSTAGSIYSYNSSYPFGDGVTWYGSADTDTLFYAGLDYDGEAQLSHAWARNYSSAEGVWTIPDPFTGSYDPNNPQSFNRYAYVLNNPLAFVDPSGLDEGDGNDGDAGDSGSDDSADPGDLGLLDGPDVTSMIADDSGLTGGGVAYIDGYGMGAATFGDAPAGSGTAGVTPPPSPSPSSGDDLGGGGGFGGLGGPGGASRGYATLSLPGGSFLRQHEGFRPTAYDDGYGNMTIGYGHKIFEQNFPRVISTAEAGTIFWSDANSVASAVRHILAVGVQQYQFDALVSLAFNIGSGLGTRKGGLAHTSLIHAINNRQSVTIQMFTGLARVTNRKTNKSAINYSIWSRRVDEWFLFTSAYYGARR